MEDRQLLAVASLATFAGTLSASEVSTTMDLKVVTENDQAAAYLSIRITSNHFDPAVVKVVDASTNKAVSGKVIHDTSSSSLLLVPLQSGDYAIEVKSNNSSYGDFTCDVFLPGSINGTGSVSSTDLVTANAAYQSSMGTLNAHTIAALKEQGIDLNDAKIYDACDIDGDGKVTSFEIDAIANNYLVGQVTVSIVSDHEGPVITAQLTTSVTGSGNVKLTSNPVVTGTVTDESNIAVFQASFDGTNWVDVSFGSNGSYTINHELMKTMTGGPIAANGDVITGQYTLRFRGVDEYNNESTSTLAFNVVADSARPVANNKTFTTGEKVSVTDSLTSLVSHPNANLGVTVEVVAQTVISTEGVSVVIGANGSFTYAQGNKFIALNDGETVTDTFTYTVKDVMGKTSTGTITITINGVNDSPVAADITRTTDQDTQITIDALSQATDPDNTVDELTISAVTQPSKGEVTIVDNKLVFNPKDAFKPLPQGQSENVTFTYTIRDPGGLTSTKTVTVTVTGKNDAPIAANTTASIGAKDVAGLIDVAASCTPVDTGSTVELAEIVTGPGKGTATIQDGKIKFDPNGQFNTLKQGQTETVTITYRVKNSLDATKTATATLTITITGVNTPPTISGDYKANVTKRDTLTISVADLLKLASDINGDPLTVTRVQSTTTGVTVTLNQANGQVIYNPGSTFLQLTGGQTATDTFKYWVSDGYAETEGTVTVTITGSNDPLKIDNQTLSVTSSGTGTTLSAGTVVLSGYSAACVFEIVGTPTGGPPGQPMPTFSINASTGAISVSKTNLPAATAAGQGYVLTVKVTNPNDSNDTDTATITINVVEKTPPTVPSTPLKLTTSEDATSAVTGTITGVTHDEPFVFETALAAKSFTIDGVTYAIPTGFTASVNATTGVVSFNPNGKFDLIPEGKNGILILEYTVRDTVYGVTATGTIEVTISGVNSQPVSKGPIPEQTTNQNTNLTFDVRPFFEDPDVGDVLRVQAGSVTVTGGGSVSINGSGNIVFNPGNDFKHLPVGQTAEVEISFVITDRATGGLTVAGKFKVIVTGLNDAPVARDFTAPATDKNKPTGNITVANTGSTDPDNNETATLEYCWIGRGTESFTVGRNQTVTFANGDKVTISSNGRSLVFTPGPAYADNGKGTDVTATFQYKVKDVHGAESNAATISVLVRGLNDPPELKKDIVFEGLIGTMGGPDKTVDLRQYFTGQNLVFDMDNIIIDPDVPASQSVITVSIDPDGYTLRVKFLPGYNSSHTRTFNFSVYAANTDGDKSVDALTFKVVSTPETTLEVVAKPVKESESSRFNATGTYKTPEDMHVDFEVNVNDRYYLEIWVSDTLFKTEDYATFSRGLAYLVVSLQYDSSVARIVSFQFPLAGNADDFDAYYGPTGGNISEPGLISGLGGGISTGFAGQGLGANGSSFKMVRILVEAVGAGNPNFEFIRPENYDDWDESVFYFSRLATQGAGDGLSISNDQIKTIAPSITHAAPAPLLAAETPEKIVTGGVYPRVVTTPTSASSNGTFADIPKNADWIHEWQEHWVELWVKASEVAYFLNGTCDLNYNTNYFTAVEVELSPAFNGNSTPVIHDALGKVTGIGGNATQLVSGDGYVLLGRVKFQSIGSDNVPFEEAWFAHDLGISLENVKMTTSSNEVLSYAGKSPRTELWAVPYDTNDSGSVQAMDYTQFLSAFVDSRELSSYLLSFFDFNKDGKVDAQDYTFFLAAFGITRESGVPVPFPQSFTQRYVGKKLDADSAATVNKIIDAANKSWQTALGLDRPVEIQIVVQDFGTDNIELAHAQITAVDAKGLPLKGIITLDSTAAGMGWYSQIDEPVATGRYDLFTVLLHEMGHIYGFNTSYDAFNAVVGEYVDQLDKSGLHSVDPNDLMYATLETGLRKYISTFNTAIISSAYETAQANPGLGFSNSTAALSTAALSTAALSVETLRDNDLLTPDLTAFVVQDNGGLVTTLNHPVLVFATPQKQMIDADTALRLHAMGLAVALPITMQQRDENRISFAVEQIYCDEGSFFDLDDDLMTLYQPQDADESELALIDLTMDLNV